MEYRTYPPPAGLARHVRFYWSLESTLVGDAPHRLTADPCPGLLFICEGNFREADGQRTPTALLAGPIAGFTNNVATGPFSLFGVYLWPWSVPCFFGSRPDPFIGSISALEALWGKQGQAVEKRMIDLDTHQQRVGVISELLHERLSKPDPQDPVIERIVEHILVDRNAFTVEELIAQSGLARRQFERRFKECTGFAPALFTRIVRFQRTYRMLENGTATSLTDVALACGYFDQSHFIRDFKRFSGLNPRDYFVHAPEKVDNFVRLP